MACVSNLRQLHAHISHFASDNDGALPVGYRQAKKQFNTTLSTNPGESNPDKSKYVLLGRLISSGFLKDPHVLYCPSERDNTQKYNTGENPWPGEPEGKRQKPSGPINPTLLGGYGSNPIVEWKADDGGDEEPSERPTQVNFNRLAKLDPQAHAPLAADGVGLQKRVDSRHKDGVNVVYTDGSARWVPVETKVTWTDPDDQNHKEDYTFKTELSNADNNDAQDHIWRIFAGAP